MKANNTIIYPQIQAIEPTPKSKKSSVLMGVGFMLFIGGMALYGFGIVYKFSLAFGVISAIVGFLTVAAGNKLAPSCEFPKKEHKSNHNDDYWDRTRTSLAYDFMPRNIHYKD